MGDQNLSPWRVLGSLRQLIPAFNTFPWLPLTLIMPFPARCSLCRALCLTSMPTSLGVHCLSGPLRAIRGLLPPWSWSGFPGPNPPVSWLSCWGYSLNDRVRIHICRELGHLQSMFPSIIYVCALVAQSYLTLCDPIVCNLLDSSVDRILQARILEWVAILFSRGSSWPRDQIWVSWIAGRFFTIWAHQGSLLSIGTSK